MRHSETSRAVGFTLIELLAVIAIIGILAAILIPTVSSVRVAAKKARTKVQFSQWAAAIEAFRSEYGYYPQLDSNLVNGGASGTGAHLFHDILAGRQRDGDALTGSAAQQNRKRIGFYSFGEGDFTAADGPTPNLIQDACDDTEVAVLVDRDLDGRITSADSDGNFPSVHDLRPTATDIPPTGLRVGVAFYAAAPGATADNPRFIFSWK